MKIWITDENELSLHIQKQIGYGRDKTSYINIQTDFGFKEVLGQVKNKKALIRFINILFADKLTVKDVVYHDKEILPSEEEGKRIVYDVYCTMPTTKSASPFFPDVQKDEKRWMIKVNITSFLRCRTSTSSRLKSGLYSTHPR